MALKFNELDDLELLDELKKSNPNYKITPGMRKKLFSELVKSKGHTENNEKQITQLSPNNDLTQELLNQYSSLGEELKRLREELKTKEFISYGSIVGMLKWDIRFVHDISNKEFLIFMLILFIYIYFLADLFFTRFKQQKN